MESQYKNKGKNAIIAGAGPAGLTAAYELAVRTNVHPIVFECTNEIGGISRTVQYNGNRIDIGGHRFFSKNQRVMNWWAKIMPIQTAAAKDELLLGEHFSTKSINIPVTVEADPSLTDRVMLTRRRVSRIYYLRKFFDYPISMSIATIRNMGVGRTISAAIGYIVSLIHKRKEDSLEDFYINRFGKKLYSMFFEDYTEKVWGLHPSKLGADWGSQRVKGLSIISILKDILRKQFSSSNKNANIETSLIEEFIYPKYGPGQLWETVAKDMCMAGGEIEMNSTVKKIHVIDNRVTSVSVEDKDGKERNIACDYFISSMPIKDLVAAIDGIDVPNDIMDVALSLPYRDFMTVGLLVDKLKIKNITKLKTYLNRVPDTWIYVQERDVKLGRIQIFNNWSPYLVKEYETKMWIGLEYFCFENDEMWNMSDSDFIKLAIDELSHIGIIEASDVEDAVRIKVKKAYPAYYGAYYQLNKVIEFLNTIENLYCVGRNGQHRYNNMDHSMLTAMETVDSISDGNISKENIWKVNTETEYHESK